MTTVKRLGITEMLSRYGSARFRQISSGIGFFPAVRYTLGNLTDIIANVVAELVSGFKEHVCPAVETDTIAYCDFRKAKKKDNYYRNRWNYLRKVIDWVKAESPKKVLELGPRILPIVKNSDTMDIQIHEQEPTYLRDAKDIPWPIEDSKYDLFIALQVWEHLGDRQREAFKEVVRVSRAAVLSFPYKRYFPGDCHHGIDEKKIAEWTMGVAPERVVRTGPVIMYFFRF